MDDPTPQDNSSDQGDPIQVNGQATPTPPPVNGPAADDSAITGSTGASTKGDDDYNVPAAVLEKYPKLVELIKKTESMSPDEREYWFQILPIMTEEQVTRLRGILEEEKTQLEKLDVEYQDEMSKLNQKHLNEWDEFSKKKDREARKEEEAKHEEEEAKAEEDILGELDNL